jgi:hypothetical protein
MQDENLISLKEASRISGYSPDYIGQLIRSGKIIGKQIYTGVAWMTTTDAVMAYKNKSKISFGENRPGNWFIRLRRRIKMEFEIIKLFAHTFKTSLPILLVLVLFTFIFLLYFGMQIITKTTDFSQYHKDILDSDVIFSY